MIDISEDELKSMLMEAWVAGWFNKDTITDEGKIKYSENVIVNIKYKIKDFSTIEKRFLEEITSLSKKEYDTEITERYSEMLSSVRTYYLDIIKDIFNFQKEVIKEQKQKIEKLEIDIKKVTDLL